MKKISTHLLHVLLILFVSSGFLTAQEISKNPKDPIPAPPFVGRAPEVAGWKMNFYFKAAPVNSTNSSPTAAPAPNLEITVYKADNRRLEIIPARKGGKEERFYANNVLYYQKPGFAPTDVYTRPAPGAADNDFPELYWIKAEHYMGVKREKGKRYYVFMMDLQTNAAPASLAPQKDASSNKFVSEAWIDMETKLPLKYDDGTYIRTYEFFKSSANDAIPSPGIRRYVESLQAH